LFLFAIFFSYDCFKEIIPWESIRPYKINI
jgi:hypothetical protein